MSTLYDLHSAHLERQARLKVTYEPVKVAPLHNILNQVAFVHGLKPDDLKSRGRNRVLVAARWEYCYRALTETPASLPQIARLIDKDHTSVMHAVATYCMRNQKPFPRGADWVGFKNRAERVRELSRKRRASAKQGASDYDANKDFADSINDCYAAIRDRKAAGGKGWGE